MPCLADMRLLRLALLLAGKCKRNPQAPRRKSFPAAILAISDPGSTQKRQFRKSFPAAISAIFNPGSIQKRQFPGLLQHRQAPLCFRPRLPVQALLSTLFRAPGSMSAGNVLNRTTEHQQAGFKNQGLHCWFFKPTVKPSIHPGDRFSCLRGAFKDRNGFQTILYVNWCSCG